ncbi:MAG: hypothetical protein JWL73_3553 [Actinomycetia bacterium]|nr:hypothetical protein [Actinomycetes bacterium]
MTDDTDPARSPDPAADEQDDPSLRQRLHSATGDRDAEATALADRAGDVDEAAAQAAVRKAHGDLGPGQPGPESDLATPADAEAAKKD